MVTDVPAIGAQLPFLFSYRDTLFGIGFVVHVEARNGRALCGREDDGWWTYGVNPGGMAAYGEDPHAAHATFRKTLLDVLLDIAKDTRSFDECCAQVESFFEATNTGNELEWSAAAAAVRAGHISRDDSAWPRWHSTPLRRARSRPPLTFAARPAVMSSGVNNRCKSAQAHR